MSRANVEIVRGPQPGPDVDVAAMFRGDDAFRGLAEAAQSFFHPDFECVMRVDSAMEATYVGIDGLRAAFVDWLAPWATYRTEIEEIIEAGERVVVLVRDFGRRDENSREVELIGTTVYTFRDDRVARVEFYADRTAALQAAGLAG
jgi:ketosteroid isomerase-like protein